MNANQKVINAIDKFKQRKAQLDEAKLAVKQAEQLYGDAERDAARTIMYDVGCGKGVLYEGKVYRCGSDMQIIVAVTDLVVLEAAK